MRFSEIAGTTPLAEYARMLAMSEYGDVIVRNLGWRRIEIVEAAPRVLITGELLEAIRAGVSPHAMLDGDVLTIKATNRTVIYRIVGRHPDRLNRPDTWIAEWPD